jgi:hypothetical protein
MPVILATPEGDQEDLYLQSAQAKMETLSQKYPTQKRAGRVGQAVECLPSRYEPLSSKIRFAWNTWSFSSDVDHIYFCLPELCSLSLKRSPQTLINLHLTHKHTPVSAN